MGLLVPSVFSRIIKESLAEALLHFILVVVAISVACAGGCSPEGINLSLETQDAQLRLLEVIIEASDLALHAALQLMDDTKNHVSERFTK